jgi:hypothetical protein
MLVSVFAIIATTLAAIAQASPVASPAAKPSMKLLKSEPLEQGTLDFYGYDTEVQARAVGPSTQPRYTCGDNPITCNGNHEAYYNTCQQLRQDLVNRKNDRVGLQTTKICRTLDDRNKCCTSWVHGVKDLTIGWLIPGLDAGMKCNGVKHSNVLSAEIHWVLLGDKCNTQCLSNGDGDCQD